MWKVKITSYLPNFFLQSVLILLILHFTKTHLYSNEILKFSIDDASNKNNSIFKQIQKSDRLFFSHKKFYYVFVSASALNLRSGPGVRNSVLRIIPGGTHLFSNSSKNSDWLRVYAPQNFKGWVARKHVIFYQPKSLKKLREKINSMQFKSLLEAGILNYLKEIYDLNKLNINDKLSVIIEDLENANIVASINKDKIIKSASTIKVPILHAYMIKRTEGKLIENKNLRLLIEKMIRFSSNSSTNIVINQLGGLAKIQNILEQTKIYNQINLIEYIPENGRAYRNTISVSDLNRLLRDLWFKKIIGSKFSSEQNRRVSNEMLNLLKLPGYPWLKDRIRAGTCFSTNKTVKLWDKTGFVKGSNGNAGIIEINTPFGRKAYSIVIFIGRNNFHSIKENTRNWFKNTSIHMRKISEMTFAYFSNQYHNFNKCGIPLLKRFTRDSLF